MPNSRTTRETVTRLPPSKLRAFLRYGLPRSWYGQLRLSAAAYPHESNRADGSTTADKSAAIPAAFARTHAHDSVVYGVIDPLTELSPRVTDPSLGVYLTVSLVSIQTTRLVGFARIASPSIKRA